MKYLSNLFLTYKEQKNKLKKIDKNKRMNSIIFSLMISMFLFLPIYLMVAHLFIFVKLITFSMYLMVCLTLFMLFTFIYLKYFILKVKYGERYFMIKPLFMIEATIAGLFLLTIGILIVNLIGVYI